MFFAILNFLLTLIISHNIKSDDEIVNFIKITICFIFFLPILFYII